MNNLKRFIRPLGLVAIVISLTTPLTAHAGKGISTISISCANGFLSVPNAPGGTSYVHYFNSANTINSFSFDKKSFYSTTYAAGTYVSATANAHNGATLATGFRQC